MTQKLTQKEITNLYRQWRKENGNKRPNRVDVLIQWDDDDVTCLATIGLDLVNCATDKDDLELVWYTRARWLHQLRQPDNGSDFVLKEILEFYKA